MKSATAQGCAIVVHPKLFRTCRARRRRRSPRQPRRGRRLSEKSGDGASSRTVAPRPQSMRAQMRSCSRNAAKPIVADVSANAPPALGEPVNAQPSAVMVSSPDACQVSAFAKLRLRFSNFASPLWCSVVWSCDAWRASRQITLRADRLRCCSANARIGVF